MQHNFKRILSFAFLAFTFSTAAIATPIDTRENLPAVLDNSYVGFGVGDTVIPYSNAYLMNGFSATRYDNPSFGLMVYLGHYFSPHLAAQISLMRPVKWAYAYGVSAPSSKNSIWVSLFGISLKPIYAINSRMNVYALGGLGIVSRHGFTVNNTTAIPSSDLFTFLTGAGLTYAMTSHWYLDAGVQYALAQSHEHQPSILYTYGSVFYRFAKSHVITHYADHFLFPKHLIQVGGFSTSFWNPNINKYFTVGYLPIFWSGDVKTKNGFMVSYNNNVYHTHKFFSFDLGASYSHYHSLANNTSFDAFSVFPTFRFWLIRKPSVDFYFMYSIAGPTLLTQRHIDGQDLGGSFTFQDLMGIGMYLGTQKKANIALTIGHYSNGNLLPNNPGIEVPLTISMGYAF